MEEQRILIDEAFETRKDNIEQIDNVFIIGVRTNNLLKEHTTYKPCLPNLFLLV